MEPGEKRPAVIETEEWGTSSRIEKSGSNGKSGEAGRRKSGSGSREEGQKGEREMIGTDVAG
ncbi:hypothetical protein K0M31_007363 [Melipona bicolor]|uniref:Uncharacterized protein n=1 Tax=Melipona bicolor TaxID=60889 RepID=A0AA40KVN1_9HYME|nr:hypothetical protein K0M31_007363 [Melipona bicolor]